MRIPPEKVPCLADVIKCIYKSPWKELEILSISQTICTLLDAQYFALMLFSTEKTGMPTLISNNPPEFYKAYNDVYSEDFLTKAIVSTGKSCVLQKISGWNDKRNQNFLTTLAQARPASDGIYIPIKGSDGILQGVWAIARAEMDSPPFSNEEIGLFRFIADFLSDSYRRFPIKASIENMAYLDSQGHILMAGARLRALLSEAFGKGRLGLDEEKRRNLDTFFGHYRRFISGSLSITDNRAILFVRGERRLVLFHHLEEAAQNQIRLGSPVATASYVDPESIQRPGDHWDGIDNENHFTAREREVIRGIFKGMSNKEIACQMKVDESTVKRHAHNVYEKTGLYSRVELVLNLPYGIVKKGENTTNKL